MQYILFFIFLCSSPFCLSEAKTAGKVQTNKQVKTQASAQVKKPSVKASQKPAGKKTNNQISLEKVSQSTALIISGAGDNMGTGSGFFIAKSLLVTNSHVVDNATVENNTKIVAVETQTGVKDIGFVFAEDIKNDLAIIKTGKNTHKPLKLGKYNKVKMGDEIFVLGSPHGLIGTLSKGIVSSKRKVDNLQLLQITAPISQGSSGSPVLSKDLKVIGVVVANLKESQNLNFAVPVTYLKKLIRANKKDLIRISKLNLEKTVKNPTTVKFQDLKTDVEKGTYYYDRHKYKQAFYWFKKTANQGFALAQLELGVMYDKGQGFPQDYKQAVYWYKKSANQGNAEAQYNLGVMYAQGQGLPQDYKQAFYWYKKSANQGFALAQFNLGLMYAKGHGVSQNYKQAFYWYKKSANQGFALAQYNLGSMYAQGQGARQDYKQAVYWYKKSANQEFALAQSHLGLMYAQGQGARQDYKQAFYWYKKSANQGKASAQSNLGVMYAQGLGVLRISYMLTLG